MFSVKAKLFLASLGLCLLMPVPARAGSAPGATVAITGTVDTFAEWADVAPAVTAADWDGHVTQANQSRTISKALTLYTNTDTTITPEPPDWNLGILTSGSQTLVTSYMVTGSVTTPDAAFKAAGNGAGQFFNASNTYTVPPTVFRGPVRTQSTSSPRCRATALHRTRATTPVP